MDIDRNTAESLINILRGCHQQIKTTLVHGDSGELYDIWSERSEDTIIAMIGWIADAIGCQPYSGQIPPFTEFWWELSEPEDATKSTYVYSPKE